MSRNFYAEISNAIYPQLKGRLAFSAGLFLGLGWVIADTKWGLISTNNYHIFAVMGTLARLGLGMFLVSLGGLLTKPAHKPEIAYYAKLFSEDTISKKTLQARVAACLDHYDLHRVDELVNLIKDMPPKSIPPDKVGKLSTLIEELLKQQMKT